VLYSGGGCCHITHPGQRLHQPDDELRFLQQKGTVVASTSDALRAAEVQVDRITSILHQPRRGEQRERVIAYNTRSVRSAQAQGRAL
jgi:hypothetical protein